MEKRIFKKTILVIKTPTFINPARIFSPMIINLKI